MRPKGLPLTALFSSFHILGRNLEIGAHVCSKIDNLICLRHLFRARAVSNLAFVSEKDYFPSQVRIMFEQPYIILVL